MKIPEICYKSDLEYERAQHLHPQAQICIVDHYQYCAAKKLPFIITASVSTLAEDIALARVSKTHRQRRAWDVSVKGWSQQDIQDYITHFNIKYKAIGSVTAKGEGVFVICHDNGNGLHLHHQLNPSFCLPEISEA